MFVNIVLCFMFLQLSQIVNARVHNLFVGDNQFHFTIKVYRQVQKYENILDWQN